MIIDKTNRDPLYQFIGYWSIKMVNLNQTKALQQYHQNPELRENTLIRERIGYFWFENS